MCAPKAPSAAGTANAQSAANYTNQYTPYGNLVYNKTGSNNGVDTYSATTTLSPQAQQALDASLGAQTNVANAARGLSANIGQQLGQPIDFSQQQTYLNNLTAQNLNPQWDRLDQQNQTDLTNKGLRPGSTAYNDARDSFLGSRSNAYNSANLANYGQALSGQLALRQAPLNELTGLLSASQVQSPQFANLPTTDVAGITNAAYGNQMANYSANQGLLGGLFSAGANLFSLSDRRAKTDVKRIGQTDAGTPIYLARYKHGGPMQLMYMAQDLLETQPEAVVRGPDGLYRVNYEAVR